MGSGRSGTSALAGCLSGLGYFMGDHPFPIRDANPKGVFEDFEINAINDALIASALPKAALPADDGWLASVALGSRFTVRSSLRRRMTTQAARAPLCFKDPRFCYTLPSWRPYLGDALFVCVFREPARTANSIVDFPSGVDIDFDEAIRIWTLMYRHVLDLHRHEGDWVFAHYDQVLDGSAIERVASVLGVTINTDFPDPELRRSPSAGLVGREATEVYAELCEAAGFYP
jgi:hypothetical protein